MAAKSAAILDRHSTRWRSRTAVGAEEWLRRGQTKEWARKQVSCQDFVITIREGRHQFSWHKKQEQSRISPSDTVVVLTLTGEFQAYRDALNDVRALLGVDPTVLSRIRKPNELFTSITASRLCEATPHCSAEVADRLTHTFALGKQPRMLRADSRSERFGQDNLT